MMFVRSTALGVVALLLPAQAAMTQANRDKTLADHTQYKKDEQAWAQSNGKPVASGMHEYEYDMLLEQVAQNYLNGLSGTWQTGSFSHNSAASTDYAALGGSGYVGENWFSGGPDSAVYYWCDYEWSAGCSEKDAYYTQGTCNAGSTKGHYTQVVWDSSTKVGCGYTTAWGTICNYSPGGNFNGETPYEPSGTPCTTCNSGYTSCDGMVCTKPSATQCPADGDWPATNAGNTANLGCTTAGHVGGRSRPCDGSGVWGSVTDTCVLATCSANGGYPQTNAGTSASIACGAGMTGMKTRACDLTGSWEAENASACTQITCAANGGYPTTNAGETASVACGAGWSGTKTRVCDITGSWEAENASGCTQLTCSANGGFPATNAGASASIACPSGMSGNQSRACDINGNWGAADLSSCTCSSDLCGTAVGSLAGLEAKIAELQAFYA